MIHFAIDLNNNRVFIDHAKEGVYYYCENCGARVIAKRGEERAHHYAHKYGTDLTEKQLLCREYEERQDSDNEMSDWHLNWQKKFPEECRERWFTNDKNEIHRADIFIEKSRTVVEFQHSMLSSVEFVFRNNFYISLGYNVVWLYDFDSVMVGAYSYVRTENANEYERRQLSKRNYNYLYHVDRERCWDLFGSWMPQNERDKNEYRVTVFFSHAVGEYNYIRQMQMIPDSRYTSERSVFASASDEESFIEFVNTRHSYVATKKLGPEYKVSVEIGQNIREGMKYEYHAVIELGNNSEAETAMLIKQKLGTGYGAMVSEPKEVVIVHSLERLHSGQYDISFITRNEATCSVGETIRAIENVVKVFVKRIDNSQISLLPYMRS